ncbi:DNA-binding protein [Aerococcus urinaehominis]|uniref:DNA-binding protein n=1 Tax=Aerococcus urinaehominis TaxID=128944 RepID=A0A120IB08_9LACT|nr:S1-like domain-containing RNA-binding protein [Aerococcus urinaehominis]AMB99700.1 DNA-binding protein [Aerococcus urinaehominis]SDL91060.1 hypothetical protein SAMN04487985_102150 [Aerococcus urinaehominis]
MNQELGSVVTALITDKNDQGYFVQRSGLTYKLLAANEDYQLGDTVRGFIYENSKGQKIMTQDLPSVRQNRYAWAQVTSVKKDLGVFTDIGLPDKDIVVSLDDLPTIAHTWPKIGDYLFIRLEVDKKNRLWGKLAEEHVFQAISYKLPSHSRKFNNQEVTARVYRAKLAGSQLLTEDYHLAFIHTSEFDEEPRLGEQVKGRVIGVGQNGNLNLSLKPLAHAVLDDDALMILAMLERRPDGFLPFNDKSDPQAIRNHFGLSKAQFKRALGRLMKDKKITQNTEGIERI